MTPWIYSRASEFLDSLFQEEFGDQARYDPEVVRLV